MRLIDADALPFRDITIDNGLELDTVTVVFKRDVDNATTVDTRCTYCDSGYAQGYSDGYLKGKDGV